ncbi:glycosyltransferase family 2 protein [Microbacterium esteraromaticum]|uniref:glycosyltransferase n=1 Tax=Microbacterium esteraromaticum TaxID=57043 RepID=UPI001A8F145E|nr:glycosyltransferase family 2 protein [Microbacterium esteraromaticum]
MTAHMTDVLSVVVPVYNVSDYLPEFLASLDAQAGALPREFIFIDDGSTDDSAGLVQKWIDERHPSARMVSTRNRGVSAARNTGLDEVSGDWVLFLDPDDVLGSDYFAALYAFFARDTTIDLVATNLLRLQDPDRVLRDTHPLRFRFAGGTRIAPLEDDVFIMNAASVAFPVRAVRDSGARFRTGLHASEDALFVAEYLLNLERTPRAGFVAGAEYGYRKRAARTSAVDRYRSDPSTYTVRFHEGYAPLLERSAQVGAVPSWLQSMLLYEMQWLLPVQMDPQRYAENLDPSQRAHTLAGLSRCLRHVSEERLLSYDASALPWESRMLILALTARDVLPAVFATTPRKWRSTTDLIRYSRDITREYLADAPSSEIVSWAPDVFGQQVLFAHRLRADSRVRHVTDHDLVWPRPGETLAQTQDRYRRYLTEEHEAFIPAHEHEVYVRRTRSWSPNPKTIRQEARRRSLWSKDAWIGRCFRPGHAALVEHPSDGVEFSKELVSWLRRVVRTRQVRAQGSDSPLDALRFGSLRHRIARARARLIVSVRPVGRPSARARTRSLRTLVVTAQLTHPEVLRIRRFSPDLVVTAADADAAALQSIGIASVDIMTLSDLNPHAVAQALRDRVAHRATTLPRKDSNVAA